jgi:TatD DNase family protein
VSKIPTNRLLLETDIPYLAPNPHKGEVNKPSYIMYTAQKVSELLGVSLEDLSSMTISNSNVLLARNSNE